MAGITDLQQLLRSMQPHLAEEEFVFCSVTGSAEDYFSWKPLAIFYEQEGISLVVTKQTAEENYVEFDNTYKQITLTVHSSLDAVGLTAAVSTKLADHGISANVIAAFYHDHIFVQSRHANKALKLLESW
ncbi:ACT domain-containing protein [Vibrio ziniensis]|uniref:ACT domain-containing protein n=1 Tax=Vibrio ziniensis TaxID=2711221 RepID=A0A6G7CHL6_9VIBR|nr:ACT domain-containing protein [Vibrio ziniensis]QIH41528.1 ACT domain-containing protein [Vibrio ziniensis]